MVCWWWWWWVIRRYIESERKGERDTRETNFTSTINVVGHQVEAASRAHHEEVAQVRHHADVVLARQSVGSA